MLLGQVVLVPWKFQIKQMGKSSIIIIPADECCTKENLRMIEEVKIFSCLYEISKILFFILFSGQSITALRQMV